MPSILGQGRKQLYDYFLANTFTFAICHRPSVCLSVVCNVRAPYSGDWNFRQCLRHLVPWPSV